MSDYANSKSSRTSLMIRSVKIAIFSLLLIVVLCFIFVLTPARSAWFSLYKHKCGEDLGNGETKPPKLSPGDLRHGRSQLAAMLKDRPRMLKCLLAANDPIATWTIHQFAGEGTGSRIWWHGKEPDIARGQGFPSACWSNGPDGGTSIWLADIDQSGAAIPGEELWGVAVFELYNCRTAEDGAALHQKIRSGCITEDEYVHEVTLAEFDADKKSAKFFKDKWAPQAQLNLFAETPRRYAFSSSTESYEDWLKARTPDYQRFYRDQFQEFLRWRNFL